MLNALKKLRTKNELPGNANDANCFANSSLPNSVSSPDIQSMSSQLQRRFARGVHYNMKVLIRGDTNVGKTSLFRRLQGLPFSEQHCPTPEIQVASIQWSYKVTDDVVKVEVWDVVDRAHKRRSDCLLKLENSGQPEAVDAALDAEFLDVYKGADCVLLVLDVTKPWSLEYVRRQLPLVPPALPVLVLGNRCDLSAERVVQADQVRWLVDGARAGGAAEAAPVAYTDCSMRSGFGMRWLHHFFSVPFLLLQRRSLERQLELSARHMTAALQELQLLHESASTDFQLFLKTRDDCPAPAAPSPAAPPAPAATAGPATAPATVQSHDEFCPGVTLDDNFLQEADSPLKNGATGGDYEDEEDEDETSANPLVACIVEDAEPVLQPLSALSVSVQRQNSDSEEEGQVSGSRKGGDSRLVIPDTQPEQWVSGARSRGDSRLVIPHTQPELQVSGARTRGDSRLLFPDTQPERPVEGQSPQLEQADAYLSLDDPAVSGRRRERSKKKSRNAERKKKRRPDAQQSHTELVEHNSLEDFLNSS